MTQNLTLEQAEQCVSAARCQSLDVEAASYLIKKPMLINRDSIQADK